MINWNIDGERPDIALERDRQQGIARDNRYRSNAVYGIHPEDETPYDIDFYEQKITESIANGDSNVTLGMYESQFCGSETFSAWLNEIEIRLGLVIDWTGEPNNLNIPSRELCIWWD